MSTQGIKRKSQVEPVNSMILAEKNIIALKVLLFALGLSLQEAITSHFQAYLYHLEVRIFIKKYR